MTNSTEGKFVVQGVLYDSCPGAFRPLRDEFGVRRQSFETVDGSRIEVVAQPAADEARPGIEYRLNRRKAWSASWGPTSWMNPDMFKHLTVLHETGTPFWIQFDDVMSLNYDVLRCADGVGKIWLTTNNPIAPFGHTPVSPREHAGNLYVDRLAVNSGFSVDDEFGVIVFR